MTNSYYENDYRVSRFIAGGAVILFSCIGLTISYALRNVTTEGSVAGIALSVVFISIVLYVLFRFPRRVVIDSRGVYIENGFFDKILSGHGNKFNIVAVMNLMVNVNTQRILSIYRI